MSERKKLGSVKISTTQEIVEGERRDELEAASEKAFEEVAAAKRWEIEKLKRPKGTRSDSGDYVLYESEGWLFPRTVSYTVDVKSYWVSRVQGNAKSFCDYTMFMGKIDSGKLAIQDTGDMHHNLRYNSKIGAFYLPPEHWITLGDLGLELEE